MNITVRISALVYPTEIEEKVRMGSSMLHLGIVMLIFNFVTLSEINKIIFIFKFTMRVRWIQ